jgi:hypothetical protein
VPRIGEEFARQTLLHGSVEDAVRCLVEYRQVTGAEKPDFDVHRRTLPEAEIPSGSIAAE